MEAECKKHGLTNFTEPKTPKGRSRCVKCLAEGVTRFRRRVKERLIEYKGGLCVRCGYDKCQSALELHHRDPSEKEFMLSRSNNKPFDLLCEEADKCDLLCANCHREVHQDFAPV